jgi:hypothetical protein
MMGLFGTLMNKIFHAGATAEAPSDALQPGQSNESRVAAAARTGLPVGAAVPGAPAGTPHASIDIAQALDRMAAANAEKLDWKHSIGDLMKLVGMDSSLTERKELAADLKYSGDTNDSAAMNVWLHKEVMRRLAENGGKVPPELLAH